MRNRSIVLAQAIVKHPKTSSECMRAGRVLQYNIPLVGRRLTLMFCYLGRRSTIPINYLEGE